MEKTTNKPEAMYFKMSNSAITKLNDAQFRLYSYYAMRTGNKTVTWPMNKTVAKDLDWSVSKVKRIRKELKELGYITSKDQIFNGMKLYPITTVWYDEDENFVPTPNPQPEQDTEDDASETPVFSDGSSVNPPRLTSEPYNKTQGNKTHTTNTTVTNEQDQGSSAGDVSTSDDGYSKETKDIAEEVVESLHDFNVKMGYLDEDKKWTPSFRDMAVVDEWKRVMAEGEIFANLHIVGNRFKKAKRKGTTNAKLLTLSYVDRYVKEKYG